MSFLIVANPGSGDGGDADPLSEAARGLPDARTVLLEEGLDLAAEVRGALEEGRTIVALGGDGTVSAVAQHVAGTEGTMAVLPGGTLNHFAGDLGLEDPAVALDALRAGRTRRIDAGRLTISGGGEDDGEAWFVNNVGLGMYPESVRRRERLEKRFGRIPSMVLAGLSTLRRSEPLTGVVSADGDRRELRAWMLFVSNNRVEAGPGGLGSRERLDQGVLDLWLVRHRGARSVPYGLAWRQVRGRAWRGGAVVHRTARRVGVRLEGGPRPLSRDGEADTSARSVEIAIEPGALRVVVPPSGS